MPIGYFHDNVEEYTLNHLRSKRLKEGYLVTTDHGAWAFLNKEEYNNLNSIKDFQLYNFLEQRGIILTKKNMQQVVEDYRRKLSFLFQGASLHIIVITLNCNQKCRYCHSMAKPCTENLNMNKETAKKTVDFIFQSPSSSITIEFQGGEPLLNFEIIKYLVDYAKELNKKYKKSLGFSLVTNLTLINEEILEFLIKEHIGVCTSLDGPEMVHNRCRPYQNDEGTYKDVVRNIELVNNRLKNEKIKLFAMSVVTKDSLPYHKEIINEYIKLGFNSTFLKPVNPIGYAQDHVGQLTPEEFLSYWKNTLEYLLEVNKKMFFREAYTYILLLKILSKSTVNFTDLESPCGAAIGQLLYNYDGKIYTCDEAKLYDIFNIGDVYKDSYSKVLTSRKTCSVVLATNTDGLLCDMCAYKPYCGVCIINSYAETGNPIVKFPNKRCEIFQGMFTHLFEKLIFDKEYRNMFFKWLNAER